jgi:hypothetical protein
MLNVVSRGLVLALMLISLFGQVVAYTTSMPCETSVDSNADNFTKASTDCCDIECCDVNCICIANGCSSFAYLQFEFGSTRIVMLSEALYIQQVEPINPVSSLLYRPPIFTSS